ncbi:FKBP-type peptidyl-prolyl cis-trans isomerase [Thioalbus denitrificans]|uniref:Peptidyl-prolyl cis-trans isomerase n=1 Tax=Thioalbus denitrificans TaxID=547122 RepID=A0A369C9N5_9GAMM|nr:peptidylprolyl isomerase [Thioalbus denitrificans]RCX29835.1 FKBP-type peptidyl-prolyl cis-trans isomerase SlpA [Thioalbus denitrificans]
MTEKGEGIRSGCRVVMHFAIHLEDGTLVESSFGGEPLEFTVGDGTLVEGIERTLEGLRSGETRAFEIGPGEGYGYPDPDNLHTLARSGFPGEMDPEPGLVVGFTTPSGEELAGVVQSVEGDQIVVDFSHPLAGHQLRFEVEVLEVACPE